MELTSRRANGTFVPITFSGICDSFNFRFSAQDNHDTNGDSVVYQDSTGTALLTPGLMFDSHISNAFGDVTNAFKDIQNKGATRNKVIFSAFSDSAGTKTTDSFVFNLRTYRLRRVKVVGQSVVSGTDSQIINVDVPVAGSGLGQRFQNNLYTAFRGKGTFGQAGYKVGAFRDPYGIRSDSTLIHNTDYVIDSTTVNVIRDELVASSRAPVSASSRLVKGPYKIKYKYLNAIDSVFLTTGTKKMLNQTDSFIIKVNTVDNSAPTIVFDKKLNTNGAVTRRFLTNDQYFGDSILSGSTYKYHQVALGTRIFDILGLQATTNNLHQDTINSVQGPTFKVTENSNDTLRLKIYINKQDVVFSQTTRDSVGIGVGNNGFVLGASATSRDLKNDKWNKGSDVERQLLSGQTVAANMININRVIDTSGDSYSLAYSTGNNAIRFNKEGLCEVYFQVQDAQKNVHDPTVSNTATDAPFQMFKIVEKRAAYILLNKTDGTLIEVPGRTNGDDQDAWYDNNADLLDTSAAIQEYASEGQVPIRDYNDSRFAYSAAASVLNAGEMFVDILNPNYREPGVTIRALTPRMDTNDKLNSNGNGFAFRLPIDIRVIRVGLTPNAAYPGAATTITSVAAASGNELTLASSGTPYVAYDPNPSSGSDVEMYTGVENFFNNLTNIGTNIGTYFVEYKVTDVNNQYNKIYRRVNVTQRHPTFTSKTGTTAGGAAQTMVRALRTKFAEDTVLTTGITTTSNATKDEITSVTFNKNNCNIDLSGIAVGGFTDNAGGNNLAFSYKIMTKAEYDPSTNTDRTNLDVEFYDVYASTSDTQVNTILNSADSSYGNSSVNSTDVPSDLLDNLTVATGGNFLATNKIFNGKTVEDDLYMIIQATDTDSVMMAMSSVSRLSKPIIIRLYAKLRPHVYLLGQDSVSIVQYQSYIDRYVHIVDPVSSAVSSEFKKYNTDLNVSVADTSARIAWATPLPETNTNITNLANSASGTKYINYEYTPGSGKFTKTAVAYKEYNGGSINDSATSGKLQRQVTVVASNSAR